MSLLEIVLVGLELDDASVQLLDLLLQIVGQEAGDILTTADGGQEIALLLFLLGVGELGLLGALKQLISRWKKRPSFSRTEVRLLSFSLCSPLLMVKFLPPSPLPAAPANEPAIICWRLYFSSFFLAFS